MDLNYLKKITKILTESGVDEIEIEEEGLKIRISKHSQNSTIHMMPGAQVMQPVQSMFPQTTAQAPVITPAHVEKPVSAPAITELKYHEVKSPIVGTFYRAPAPDADQYVEVGQSIQKGTVLCIIEAMKLMNEIESDVSGKLVKILVENGKPVEYGQALFLVEPV
jgi:acetyl-CoA carboxylase biotin carboxyl carrier protein